MNPYFETENGKLYHGDCLEVMQGLEKVDLVLTDPPYGLDKKLSNGGGKHKNSMFRKMYEKKEWDKLIDKRHFDIMFKKSNNQIIFGANYYNMPPTRGIICWDKKQYMPTFSRWEYAWSSFNKPAKMYEIRNGKDKRLHPTQKPVALFTQIILDYNPKTIIDPFFGSGTTGESSESLCKKWVGIEKDEEYCEIAAKRIEQSTAQLRLPGF